MIRYYTAIVIFCVIALFVNGILVFENDVIDNYPDYIKEVKVRVPHEWHEAV